MISHNILQRSPEWHALRAGRFTASKAACLLPGKRGGYSAERAKYLRTLAAERVGVQMPTGYTTAAMQAGIDREPIARVQLEFVLGVEIREIGFCEMPQTMAGFSPDGLTDDARTIEIKCPEPVAFVEFCTSDEIDSDYSAQIQFGLWVTGYESSVLAYYHPDFPIPLRYKAVQRDNDMISRLCAEVQKADAEVSRMVSILKG